MTYKLSCNVNFRNEDDNKTFQDYFDPYAKTKIAEVTKNVIKFLDKMIEEKETKINSIRSTTFKYFGVVSEDPPWPKESKIEVPRDV